MSVRIINADVMDGLAQLPDESVHCVVTSPPYWGLRDYGVPGQLGLEPTLGEHIEAMVKVFREVRRVLRKDGTLWLNYGDCYASSVNGRKAADIVDDDRTFRDKPISTVGPIWRPRNPDKNGGNSNRNGVSVDSGSNLKPKDLCGVPWRVAFALQADGWWLRQDIIWSKPNPMPESIKDRCTKAHEYLFLLAKSERYYFDAEAIAERRVDSNGSRFEAIQKHGTTRSSKAVPAAVNPISPYVSQIAYRGLKGVGTTFGSESVETRNKRSVWEIATQPFPEAHFATFPPALIEPCIKAGCPQAWPCSDGTTKPGTVLDPFGGSGTTGLVSDRLKRNAILIELNPEYAAMAEKRIRGDSPLFTSVSA
jgi:DNA modification methylase